MLVQMYFIKVHQVIMTNSYVFVQIYNFSIFFQVQV